MASQSIRAKGQLVYRSRVFADVLRRIESVARCGLPVLFRGESGVGKNLLARHLHEISGRPDVFISWCISQTAPALAHAAIFGAVKGAYTGLDHQVAGVIDKADSGTLLIDEIDKASGDIQAALLRLLDDRTYCWLGSTDIRETDALLLFATNRDLDQMSKERQFLPDLAHRLRILTVDIPPLRERPEDIPPLILHIAAQVAVRFRRPAPRFTRKAMAILAGRPWPGNVREVSGAVMNMMASLNGRNEISSDDVHRHLELAKPTGRSDSELAIPELRSIPAKERRSEAVISMVLDLAGGCGAEAARKLGLPLRTFRHLQSKFRMRRKDRQRKPISAKTVQ